MHAGTEDRDPAKRERDKISEPLRVGGIVWRERERLREGEEEREETTTIKTKRKRKLDGEVFG